MATLETETVSRAGLRSPQAPMRVQDYLDDLGSAELVERAAWAVLEGRVPRGLPEKDPTRFLLGLLKWAVSRRPEAELQWAAVVRISDDERLRDRDRYVANLWSEVRPGGQLADLRELIETRSALEAYRRHLFRWYLERFNLADALGVYFGQRGSRRASLLVQLVLSALSVGVVAVAFASGGVGILTGLAAFAAIAGLGFLSCRAVAPLPAPVLAEALIPRLGAAVGVGYLFLAAGIHLVHAIYDWGRPPLAHGSLALLLLAGIYAYTLLQVSRRVQPPLGWWEVSRRAASILAVGMTYAAAGLAFAAPALFSQSLYGVHLTKDPGLHHLLLVATVALAVGMVLQLAWDERPMTDPL